jgi:NAD(P)-dependent dehydrogenase (short-subunit alcohol dehydrogenase family)
MNAFDGHVALVTGGGQGLGATIARELGAGGAAVVVTDMNLDTATAVADEIVAAGGKAIAVKHNTTVVADHEAAVNAAPDSFGDVAYSVRDTQAARTKAREAAIKDAVDKARVYTEGAGFRLGRLLLVEEGGNSMIVQTGNRAVRYDRVASTVSAEAAVPALAAEPQLYTAEVSIVYEIGQAIAPK